MNQKKKIKGSTHLAVAHQAGPAPLLLSQPNLPFRKKVVFNLESTSSSVESCQAPDSPPPRGRFR
jgi:hypothetical protein